MNNLKKKIPNQFENSSFFEEFNKNINKYPIKRSSNSLLHNNENGNAHFLNSVNSNAYLSIPENRKYFNKEFLKNMNNPNSTLELKAEQLINLIKTYDFWEPNSNKSFKLISESLFRFLLEHKSELSLLIKADKTHFLFYNIIFYMEYRNYINNNENFISIKDFFETNFSKKLDAEYQYKRILSDYSKTKYNNFLTNFHFYPILQIIEIIMNSTDEFYFVFFVTIGYLNGLKYLYKMGLYNCNKYQFCGIASKYRHFDCLKYLHEIVQCPWDSLTCRAAARNGDLKILKYAHENGCPWNRYTCSQAANEGHIKCLMYAHENNCPWDFYTCFNAAAGGHLECLIYAHENGCPWSSVITVKAAENGHLECLQYAFENGCPRDNETCYAAAEFGHLDCLKYAHEMGFHWAEDTCFSAAGNGHLECLQYAHENGCPWNSKTCNYAAKNGHLNCLEYAICNGCEFDYKNYDFPIQQFIDNLGCLKKKNNYNRNKNI